MFRKPIIALLAALTLTLTACGGQQSPAALDPDGDSPQTQPTADAPAGDASGDIIQLTFMHMDTDEGAKDNMDTASRVWAVNRYIENHQGTVNVAVTAIAHDDYQVKIQAQAAANDLPDVFHCKGSWLENFVQNGMLADVTAYYEALPYKDDYYARQFEAMVYGGRVYGNPIMFLSPSSLFFYNEALWAQAGYDAVPTTFDEIFAAAASFQELGVTAMALGNKDKWPIESTWLSCLGDRFTGTAWFDSIVARDGVAKFTDEDFVDMLRFTADVGASGILNPDFNSLTNQQTQDLYAQGRAASTIEGYWAVDYFIANADEEVLANTHIAVLPQPAGATKGNPDSISNGAGWFGAVNAKLEGAKLEAATAMIFEIYGPEMCSHMAAEYGNPGPIRVENMDTSSFHPLKREYLAIVDQYTDSGVPIYDGMLHGSIVDVMNSGLQEVLAGAMEPEELAAQIQAVQESLSA